MESSGGWVQDKNSQVNDKYNNDNVEVEEYSTKKYKFRDFMRFPFEQQGEFLLDQNEFSKSLYHMLPSIRPVTVQRLYEQKKDKNGMIDQSAWKETRELFLAVKKIHEDLRENSMRLRKIKDGEYAGKLTIVCMHVHM